MNVITQRLPGEQEVFVQTSESRTLVLWADSATGLDCVVRYEKTSKVWCGYVRLGEQEVPERSSWGYEDYAQAGIDCPQGLTFLGSPTGVDETCVEGHWLGYFCDDHRFHVSQNETPKEKAAKMKLWTEELAEEVKKFLKAQEGTPPCGH